MSLPPILPMKVGLYLHIPFCKAKCPYCDFYSETTPPEETLYLKALEREIEKVLAFLERKLEIPFLEIDTFYAGGGTPSLLSPSFYERLFKKLSKSFKFNPSELTIEANPESLTFEKARAYREIGFNRLSLGIQTFSKRGLRFLGRIHGPKEAIKALEGALKASFTNLNLDFIYGWKGEGLKVLERDLKISLSFHPTHLSFYELTIYPDTPFYHLYGRNPTFLKEKKLLELAERIENFLEERGFRHYEISNYALPGYECKHNLKYWKVKPYLGIGAGAVSRFGNLRLKNPENLKLYFEKIFSEKEAPFEILEVLNERELAKEYLFMGLRLTEGIEMERLKEWGYKIKEDLLNLLLERGLLEIKEETNEGHKVQKIALTKKGRFLHNQVVKFLWEALSELNPEVIKT